MNWEVLVSKLQLCIWIFLKEMRETKNLSCHSCCVVEFADEICGMWGNTADQGTAIFGDKTEHLAIILTKILFYVMQHVVVLGHVKEIRTGSMTFIAWIFSKLNYSGNFIQRWTKASLTAVSTYFIRKIWRPRIFFRGLHKVMLVLLGSIISNNIQPSTTIIWYVIY
jgi:hypothetical protein